MTGQLEWQIRSCNTSHTGSGGIFGDALYTAAEAKAVVVTAV